MMKRIIVAAFVTVALGACYPKPTPVPTFPTCAEDPNHPLCDLPPGFVDGCPVGSTHPEDDC